MEDTLTGNAYILAVAERIQVPTTMRSDGTLTLDANAWPGGYPMFYLDSDNSALCPDCASKDGYTAPIVAYGVNWEDPSLYCEDCSKRIESAYTEDCADGTCATIDCPICAELRQ